jgi:predicted kinase
MEITKWAEALDSLFPNGNFVRNGGSLLLMAGLPGSGKSYLVDHLVGEMPAFIIRTDMIRKHIFPHPSYTPTEIDTVYQVCHQIIHLRLQQGERIVFDAVNFKNEWRQNLIEIATQTQTSWRLCHLSVPPEITRQRMRVRWSDERRPNDQSDADWAVYQLLADSFEPITQAHLALDSSKIPISSLAQQVATYWQTAEDLGETSKTKIINNAH